MLFDNNNVDMDFAFLNLAGLKDANNTNPDILSAKEGFLRGNMFRNEYKPYKNLTYLDIKPTSEREAKLLTVMQYSFAINDLNLYLDVYPEDKKALRILEEIIREESIAKKEYEALYGPLDVCGTTGDKFKWLDSPWPWDNEGGSLYV